MSSLLLGKVFTGSSAEFAEAVVIEHGLIAFVGTASGASSLFPLATPIDIPRDAVVLPGFIDAHCHMCMLGSSLLKPDLVKCKTLSEIKSILLATRAADASSPRLFARQWRFDSLVDEFGRTVRPNKSILDSLFPDVPVYLDSFDLHSIWVNSEALRELGVSEDTQDPKGGSYERDEAGELTGLILETPVFEHIWPFLANQLSDKDRDDGLQRAFDAYVSTGVTGAIDMAMTEEDLSTFERYYTSHNNTLPIRVSAHWLISPAGTETDRVARVATAVSHRARLAKFEPWFRIVGIKIIVDGVIDACTAFMKEPYANGETAGPIWTLEELIPVVTAADRAGLQVACHAIGDAASEIALEALSRASLTNGEQPGRRHRLEHLESITKESVARMAGAGVIASLQPVHADPAISAFWHANLGHDARCDRAFPWSEFVDAGVGIALGTDAPTAPHFSLPNIYIATDRRSAIDPDMAPPVQLESHDRFRFSIQDALLGATRGAAHSCKADNEVGSIEVGLSADFAVLAVDPFADGTGVLRRAQEGVVQTWVAGRKVFQR